MRYTIIIFFLGTQTFQSYSQDCFEQTALDYFDKVIRPEFNDFKGQELTFYFKDKSTNRSTYIDFGNAKRPRNQQYQPDFKTIGVDKCNSITTELTSINLRSPDDFKYKRKYINRNLYVHLWRLQLWKRNDKGRFNVFVDRVIQCGKVQIVNITLHSTIDSYWYNVNIFMDEKRNVVEWYYVGYIA